jgi:outer membrane biosynthesis protein TonB
MPILELQPNPARNSDPPANRQTTGVPPPPKPVSDKPAAALVPTAGPGNQPVKVRTGRYGELEEHEIIHLLGALDEESARARFRESVYISTLFFFVLTWFLFYGPRVLFHQPQLIDPIALMKQHDKEQVTFLNPPNAPAPKPPPRPVLDRKTMQQIQQQASVTAPTPQPTAQQPPPPQEEARNTAPPVPQPQMPLPSAPKPAPALADAPLPAAPKPNFAQNSNSPGDAIQRAARNAMGARGEYGSPPGSSAPLQAGAQILSDTMGVDFSSYIRRVVADTQRNWEPLIPEEVEPPLYKKGIVGIRFTILPDGSIGEPMVLETRSGDVALDRAAWNAITSEGQFPPLPKEFHGPKLELRFGFFYNTPLEQ